VADIFFSYSAKDRERVRPICEALTALGFEVFWDQQVPAGTDWDTWIKEQLASARCAVVFWSLTSITSDNVRHEATVAKQQGRLVPVMLDPLRVQQFPMGLFNTQAANLSTWSGDSDDAEWQKLVTEIESKAMPGWTARRVAHLDAALKAETKRREIAETREDAAEAQLNQEIDKQGQLRRDRERALAEAQTARSELAGLKEAAAEAQAARAELASLKEAAAKAQRDQAAVPIAAPDGQRAFGRAALLGALVIGLLIGGAAALGLLRQPGGAGTDDALAKAERELGVERSARQRAVGERDSALARVTSLEGELQTERRARADAEAKLRTPSEPPPARTTPAPAASVAPKGTPAPSRVTAGAFDIFPGKTMTNVTAYTSPEIVSVDECRRKCAEQPRCVAYDHGRNSGNCWLYDQFKGTTDSANIEAGVKKSSQSKR
jgi:hypothetical protein